MWGPCEERSIHGYCIVRGWRVAAVRFDWVAKSVVFATVPGGCFERVGQ